MRINNQGVLFLIGGIATTRGFAPVVTNTSPQLSLRPGGEKLLGSPRLASSTPRFHRDVSVGLFRDFFKKTNNKGSGAEEDGDDPVTKDDGGSSPPNVKDEAGKDEASNDSEREEKKLVANAPESKEIKKSLPFFAAASATSSVTNQALEDDKVEPEESEKAPVDDSKPDNVTEGNETPDEVTKEPQPDEADEAPEEIIEDVKVATAEGSPGRPDDGMKEEAPVEISSAAIDTDAAEDEEPATQAEKLRAQAARIRLEAEKRIVELTLEKIEKLNTKLEALKKQDNVNTKDQKELEEELQRLKSQLVTDDKGVVQSVKPPEVIRKPMKSSSNDSATEKSEQTPQKPALSAEELERRVKLFEEAPEFLRVLVARIAGFTVDDSTPGSVDRLNTKDIIQKLHDDEVDYDSIFSKGAVESSLQLAGSELESARASIERAYKKSKDLGDGPVFTEEQINAKVEELKAVPKFLRDFTADQGYNETDLAKMLLEEEFRENKKKEEKQGLFSLFGDGEDKGRIGRDGERVDKEGSGSFSRLFVGDDEGDEQSKTGSDLSFMMESLYPKSTRKEDENPDERQVNAFLNDIVAPTKAFVPSGSAISVPGGWIIRGKNECSSGAELVEKLDRRLSNDARLREKISFYILKDPFPNQEEQMLDPSNWPQVIFVAGPDVCREPAPVLRSAISAAGIATAWYGSIYPFLANSKLLERAEEAVELSNAGMPTDLSWLSDMSIPLFLSFMGVQLIHDVAHRAVAGSKNIEVTIPTLVPSILSGITNSITSLRSSPKNKQDLLDFAVAGPLAGMTGSILLLSYGLVLTATADSVAYQSFPGLPLLLLRQSSLGGGLIDIFLGNGVLNVPMSAEGTQALASALIPLHPFAVAGYFSLIVNALSMIPVGRTDGGRVSMALFGRSGSQAATFMALTTMFVVGLSTSDLLLFYFGFAVLFQNELEVPCRNEVDDVELSRLPVAGLAWFLMLLTIIPM